MILISQGATNSFTLTLSKGLGSTANYYRMTFTSEYTSNNTKLVVFPSVITSNPRYTEFGIDCTHAGPNPLSGQISFFPPGTWNWVLDIASTLSITASSLGTLLIDRATVYDCTTNNPTVPGSPYNFIIGATC